jgi:hypothetical protein
MLGATQFRVLYSTSYLEIKYKLLKTDLHVVLSECTTYILTVRKEYRSWLKMTAFCNTAPRSLVQVNRRLRRAYCLNHGYDGGSTHLWNVVLLQRDVTAYNLGSCHLYTRHRENSNYYIEVRCLKAVCWEQYIHVTVDLRKLHRP